MRSPIVEFLVRGPVKKVKDKATFFCYKLFFEGCLVVLSVKWRGGVSTLKANERTYRTPRNQPVTLNLTPLSAIQLVQYTILEIENMKTHEVSFNLCQGFFPLISKYCLRCKCKRSNAIGGHQGRQKMTPPLLVRRFL